MRQLIYCNGFTKTVSRQQLGKHVPACNSGRYVLVDECYSPLLGNNQPEKEFAG
jgi:hypothetical protein